MFRMGIIIGTCMFFIIEGFGLSTQAGDVSSGVLEIISNIEKNDNQTVLCGHIDTLVIERENVKFILGPGDLSLFDFGSDKICAMVFQGKGRFEYFPPNPVELYQLKKFTSQDSLKGDFESACFFFVTPVNFPGSFFYGNSVQSIPFGFPLWNIEIGSRSETLKEKE